MSQKDEAKKDAEKTVSDELASQPKQDGPGTGASKEKREGAEKHLRDQHATEGSTR